MKRRNCARNHYVCLPAITLILFNSISVFGGISKEFRNFYILCENMQIYIELSTRIFCIHLAFQIEKDGIVLGGIWITFTWVLICG
jgi:hypothetical protein